ncbi:TPA: hypothetical protein ACTW3A_004928 [Klebsiella quasipneumoniae subsp. quasipneumoniae]|nr:hypothetical protein [Salmonella enterica]ECO2540719.1 hypothetical protein [Salmonella enterica]EFR1711381.1 hypothetical protein [Salmonella enterica]
MNILENYEKNPALKKTVKIVSFPFVSVGKLLVLPFLPAFLFGKFLLNFILRAQGKFEHEINSFDQWYAIHGLNEEILEDNIRATALFAWVSLIFSIVSFVLTYYFYQKGAELINTATGVVFSLVILASYFRFAVYCHCFKTRSFDRKLDVLKSLDGVLPNMFYTSFKVNEGKKNIPVQFYPKGKKIIKK